MRPLFNDIELNRAAAWSPTWSIHLATTCRNSCRSPARIVDVHQAVALANRAAYWDFQAAMGGQGSIIGFVAHHLAWPDMVHFNEAGGTLMGDRTASALLGAFAAWAKRNPGDRVRAR